MAPASHDAPPILLASRSPRRAELLRQAGIPFEQGLYPDVDESVPEGRYAPREIVERLATRKAAAVVPRAPDRVVLTADTLVVLGDRILGKPADADDARAMLRALSGATQVVVTGVAVAGPGPGGPLLRSGCAETRLTFRDLSDAEIEDYVATGEPLDKAGAYGIQGRAAGFVERLEGERDTVIGLPIPLVRALLEAILRDSGAED